MLMKYKDFKMLSKDDMKSIKGGDAPIDNGPHVLRGECGEQDGAWDYTTPVYFATCYHDLDIYCANHHGYCWTTA